jgi:Rieske Fe-S protein
MWHYIYDLLRRVVLKRREFLKSSMLASVAFGGGFVFLNDAIAADLPVKMYKKVMLSDASGKPIWFDTIAKDSPYIFCYPFNATPNFLLLLDAPVVPAKYQTNDGGSYNVPGGIGPDKTMVAYSAICPHQWSYPTREFSVINYYAKKSKDVYLVAN